MARAAGVFRRLAKLSAYCLIPNYYSLPNDSYNRLGIFAPTKNRLAAAFCFCCQTASLVLKILTQAFKRLQLGYGLHQLLLGGCNVHFLATPRE
jgi:hypothetical protein